MATFRQFLESHRDEIVPCIYGAEIQRAAQFPGIVSEVVAVACTERGRGIVACDRKSIIEAVKRAASWPLKIGTDDGIALVVTDEVEPATGKLKLIAMQTARAKLAILKRHGHLQWYNARCVYSGEEFDSRQGENPRIVDHQDLSMYPQKRGELIGAYIVGHQKPGMPNVLEQMNAQDIDDVRQEYSRELRDGDLSTLEKLPQYAIAKVTHRFVSKFLLPEPIAKMIDDRAPLLGHEPDILEDGTITSPVHDPQHVTGWSKADLVAAREASAEAGLRIFGKAPFPRNTRAPRAFAAL